MRSLLFLCLAIGLAACSPFMKARIERFDATARAYERALRWSDYRTALGLTGNPAAVPSDLSRLQDVRVTSYEIIGSRRQDEEGLKVMQVVEIHYVYTKNMSERVYIDQQAWEYVEAEQRWKLTSPFPPFR